MIHINRFLIIAVVFLLGCTLSVVQSFSYSSLPSSKQRSSTIRKQPQHHPQRRRHAYSCLSATPNNNDNKNNKHDWSIITQKTVAACVLTASLWSSPIALEQSHTVPPHHLLLSSHTASAKETTPQDLTKTYERNTEAFIGGYTVTGTKLSLTPSNNNKSTRTTPTTESFTVAQECICSAKSTPHGIFGSGANPENAFLFLATLNDKEGWTAEQTSVGATPPYKATMRFGKTAGGVHTAVGSTMGGGKTVTAFSAEQSAMGCTEGEGAGGCEAVCGKQGLSWDMIRRKCGL